MAIAGCSQLGGVSDRRQAQELWQQQQRALSAVDSWDMRARAAVKLKGEVYNIGIHWQREAGGFKMLLEAPFGQGVFRIVSSSADVYRLQLPDGQVFVNSTAEAVLEDVIGWSLPVSGLEYWIRGLPRPGIRFAHRADMDGHTLFIKQDRWSIDYLDYFSQQQPPLPRRMRLVSDTVTLKLIIEHWQSVKLEQNPSDLFPEFN